MDHYDFTLKLFFFFKGEMEVVFMSSLIKPTLNKWVLVKKLNISQ